MLAETIKLQRENRLVGKDPYDDLLAAYVSGDPEIMEKAMNAEMQKMMEGEHKELGLRFKKLLLDDRNTSMAETIHQKLKAQPGRTHFFAVGVGHLVGKGSICEQLRDKGYTVTLHQD